MKTKREIELEDELSDMRFSKWATIIVIIMMFIVWNIFTIESIEGQQLKNYLNYCETVTGQKHAKFADGGQFIGCETVVK